MAPGRKVGKSARQRRRSPRISALESRQNLDDALPALSKLGKQVWKGTDSPQNGDCVEWRSLKDNQNHDDYYNDDDVITNGNGSIMPAKHILELVLDTLQRRDTYEIFAQPVNPNEVEEYCDIIKEPMDFGTMRAKLHEGMYQNLQQFEHDVFLIPENAMHFNSSTTTYFRHARAIHELANKVFHVLKTNPQNFVTKFSGTRRRSMRKALSDSISKPSSTSSTFHIRTSSRRSPALHFGGRDGRVSDSQAADRRETYLSKEEDPSSSKSLVVWQGEIRYEDSLMWYVKDLGPTAQLVAKRKLLGQHESDTRSQPKQFKTFHNFAPALGCNPFVKAGSEESRHRRKEKTAESNKVTAVVRSRPVILALESYHSEFKSRNKRSCNAMIKPVCNEGAPVKPSPLISHFTFDLPFLKARLEQMKAVEKMGLKRKAGLSIYQ